MHRPELLAFAPFVVPRPRRTNAASRTHDTTAQAAAERAALVAASRRRLRGGVAVSDRRSGLLVGGSFVVVVVAWNVLAPAHSVSVATLVACIGAFALAATVEFEIGPGSALPTAPVQVVMLFVLPAPVVPIAVVTGLGTAAMIGRLRDPQRSERPLVLAGSAWQVVGPAAVFALAHVTRPALTDWPVYVGALAAQLALDAAASWLRNCYGLGVPTRQLGDALRFTFLCDVCLAPIGLAAVLGAPGSAGALLFLLAPTALLALLQADRRRQIDQTVALGAAFIDTNDLARRDALTGVANRLSWEETIAQYERSEAPVGVILADVDGLKSANDAYGHATGDQLLTAVAQAILVAMTSEPDAMVFRIGGDEFAVLLPGAAAASAHDLARSLRDALHGAPAIGDVDVSASLGVGVAGDGTTFGRAVATADHGVNLDKQRRGVRRR